MAIAKVQQVTGNGATLSLNGVVAGSLLVMQSSYFDNTTPDTEATPTDTNGTFSVGIAPTGILFASTNQAGGGLWYIEGAAAGSHTATPDASRASANRTYTEFSGITTSGAKDVSASGGTADTNHQSRTTGTTGTTSQNDELVIIGLALAADPGAADVGFTDPVTGFTTLQKVSNDSSDMGTFHAFKVVAATGTQSATFNWTDTSADQSSLGLIVTFKAGTPSAAITGTATATIDEADVVAGGKTIIATLTDDTFVAASVTTAITQPASANGGTTSTTSFSITLPTTAADDILVLEFCHRGLGLGTVAGTSVTVGGLTWTHKHSQNFATNTFSGQMYWTRATGNHSGQTVTGASLTNACAAIVKVKRGCVASGDPFTNAATIVGEANASGNETQAQITTLIDGAEVNLTVLNSPDLAVATHACTSPGALANEVEVLSTGGTDASISSACAVKASAGATGSFTWTQTDAAGGSYAYALEPKVTSPFDAIRQDIINGLDSAQSEGTGWNAEVRDKLAVGTVVRTSDTVCTITLSAQAGYDITAQETITVTAPATALARGVALVATPTFTVDTDGGAPDPSILIFVADDMDGMSGGGGMRG